MKNIFRKKDKREMLFGGNICGILYQYIFINF